MSRPPNGSKKQDLGGLVLFAAGLIAGLAVTLFWFSQDNEPR